MTTRIERSEGADTVVLAISGRLGVEDLDELRRLLAAEGREGRLVLDLGEVTLLDRDVVVFLAACVGRGIRLTQAPEYIRKWIATATNAELEAESRLRHAGRGAKGGGHGE
jgi:hypothetical protein